MTDEFLECRRVVGLPYEARHRGKGGIADGELVQAVAVEGHHGLEAIRVSTSRPGSL